MATRSLSAVTTSAMSRSRLPKTLQKPAPGCMRLPMARAQAQHRVFLARTQMVARILKIHPFRRARPWAKESRQYPVSPRIPRSFTPTPWVAPALRPTTRLPPTSPRFSRTLRPVLSTRSCFQSVWNRPLLAAVVAESHRRSSPITAEEACQRQRSSRAATRKRVLTVNPRRLFRTSLFCRLPC